MGNCQSPSLLWLPPLLIQELPTQAHPVNSLISGARTSLKIGSLTIKAEKEKSKFPVPPVPAYTVSAGKTMLKKGDVT